MGFVNWLRLQWDRVGAWVCIALGLLALLLGYLGVSGTPHVAEQLPYIVSGGLTGIFLLGLGGMLLLSADLSDEWRKLDDLDRTIANHDLAAAPVTESEPAPAPGTPAASAPPAAVPVPVEEITQALTPVPELSQRPKRAAAARTSTRTTPPRTSTRTTPPRSTTTRAAAPRGPRQAGITS